MSLHLSEMHFLSLQGEGSCDGRWVSRFSVSWGREIIQYNSLKRLCCGLIIDRIFSTCSLTQSWPGVYCTTAPIHRKGIPVVCTVCRHRIWAKTQRGIDSGSFPVIDFLSSERLHRCGFMSALMFQLFPVAIGIHEPCRFGAGTAVSEVVRGGLCTHSSF